MFSLRYLNCRITSPSAPVKAPSTDAIDIDACTDILIKGCTINVNDDAVALKGGKDRLLTTTQTMVLMNA